MKYLILLLSLCPFFAHAINPSTFLDSQKRYLAITSHFIDRWYATEIGLNKSAYSMENIVWRGKTAPVTLDLYGYMQFYSSEKKGASEPDAYKQMGSGIIRVNFGPEDELFGLGASYSRMRYGINDKDSFNLTDDSLWVASFCYPSLGYAHVGYYESRQVNPGADGLFDTADDRSVKNPKKLFLKSDFLNALFLFLGYNDEKQELDFITFQADVLDLGLKLAEEKNDLHKIKNFFDILLGFTYYSETHQVFTYLFDFNLNINLMILRFKTEIFNTANDAVKDYNRGKADEQQILFKEISLEVGGIFIERDIAETPVILGYIWGVSYFNDPISNPDSYYEPLNLNTSDFGTAYGYMVGLRMFLNIEYFGGMIDFRVSKNYAPNVRHTPEALGDYIYQITVQMGF